MEKCAMRLLFLIAFVAGSHSWILYTSDEIVTPGKSTDVELTCQQEEDPNVKTISSISITKQGPFGTKTTFVLLDAEIKNDSIKQGEVTVTGKINRQRGSFLNVKWQVASDDTPGDYGCEINVFDTDDNSVCLHAEPIRIKEKTFIMEDINKLILSTSSRYEQKQQALKLEISQLRDFIKRKLDAEGNQIRAVEEKFISKITVINENLKMKYTTKDEVSSQIKQLYNAISNETMTRNSDNSFQDICIELNSTFFSMMGNMNLLENKVTSMDVHLDNITDFFVAQVEQLNSNVDRCCPHLVPTTPTPTDTYGTVSMPTSPRKPVSSTMSSIAQTSAVQWPFGKYAMVKPFRGCPGSEGSSPVFHTLQPSLGSDFDIVDIFGVYLRRGFKITPLQFCYRATDSSSSTKWPKGSYCIGKKISSCPDGFTKGERMHAVMSEPGYDQKHEIRTYKEMYCCRSDAQPNKSVLLPTTDPFYLYRYKGKCQKVKGMDVQEDAIIRRVDIGYIETLTSRWTTPDVDERDGRNNLVLCRYSRST